MSPSAEGAERPLSLIVQLCAVCGPMTREEMARYRSDIPTDCGVVMENQRWICAVQPGLPELQRLYQHSPELRSLLADVMERRRLSMRPQFGEWPTAETRIALVTGDIPLFRQVIKRLSHLPSYGWLRWTERRHFWESVLGAGLAGVADLPIVEETTDLRNMAFLQYAMLPPECGSLPEQGMSGYARTALRLRRGIPSPSLPGAVAVLHMLRGEWQKAHREFLMMFPPGMLLYRDLYENLGAPLLVYAILNAIWAGASQREISGWLDAAEAVLLNYAPAHAVTSLQGFFVNLRVLAAMSGGCVPVACAISHTEDPLARVPLLLGLRQLPVPIRQRLGAAEVAESLQVLEESQLPLLARYVADIARLAGMRYDAPFHPVARGAACSLKASYDGVVLRLECDNGQSKGGIPSSGAADIPREWLVICPQLASGRLEMRNLSDILPLLQRLQAVGIPLHWQGKALHVRDCTAVPGLICPDQVAGWFEIGLRSDDGDFSGMSLAELLRAYRFRHGNYVSIGSRSYLQLSSEQLRQLDILAGAAKVERDHVYLPSAALPVVADVWQQQVPQRLRSFLASLAATPPAPSSLRATLRNYQLEGFRWLAVRAELGVGTCLADDMGLGKTIQLLALLLHRAGQGMSLVVTPLSLLDNWATEAARFAPDLKVVRYKSGSALPGGGCDLLLASYGQVVAADRLFADYRWDVLVLDEAQAIKNSHSRRSRVLCTLSARARICLTGTPVENRASDLLGLFRFLNPELTSILLRAESAERCDMLRHQFFAPLILRRTRRSVLPELPPLSEIVRSCTLSPRERSLYERERAQLLSKENPSSLHLLAGLTRLRRLCCSASLVDKRFRGESSKLTAMAEMADELCAVGHRILVFSQFTDVLDLVEPLLQQLRLSFLRMDGNTPPTQRAELVERFQKGEAPIFLLSLKVGGSGLNLTAADYVLLLDPWWNPAVEAQAIARSHRSGQQHPVTICRFITSDTVEERMLDLQRQKKDLAESLISEGALPVETLLQLF